MSNPYTFHLLGPPQIHTRLNPTTGKPNPAAVTTEPPPPSSPPPPPPMGPCLDFFLKAVTNTPPDDFIKLLEKSWTHHPLTTLKLICRLRSGRGRSRRRAGNSKNREGFFTAVLWLHRHHPITLVCNLATIAKSGCLKDLVEILYRLIEGQDCRTNAKKEWERKKKARRNRMCESCNRSEVRKNKPNKRIKLCVSREDRVLANKAKIDEEKKVASELRKEKRVGRGKKALERYTNDPDYRALLDQVSDIFAELLRSDMENLVLGRIDMISLASKWCPSIDCSYDKSTLICENIAKRVFPRNKYIEYDGIEEGHYVYRVRDRLRREVLVPLHKALDLPEVYMSARQWELVPYNKVSSVSMRKYKKLFLRHDNKRFIEYLEEEKKKEEDKIGKKPLLHPHKIIASLDKYGIRFAEPKWKRLAEELSNKGKFRKCISVCDVSSSMDGKPKSFSIALGLLVSELSEYPWKGKVIEFHRRPQLNKIEGSSLGSKVKYLREEMESGYETDFQRIYKRMLEVAYYGKLREDEMIERVFVFTCRGFERSCRYDWEKEYEAIQTKFRKYGFNKVPEMVFWNLSKGSKAAMVPSKKEGVTLVNGISKKMLTMFLERGGEMNPTVLMQSAISGEQYRNLVVLD